MSSFLKNLMLRTAWAAALSLLATLIFTQRVSAEDDAAATEIQPPKKVKYRAGKTIDLDQKAIDGKLRRPDMSVITGAEQKADDGILRLRTDFLDRITVTAGGDIQ